MCSSPAVSSRVFWKRERLGFFVGELTAGDVGCVEEEGEEGEASFSSPSSSSSSSFASFSASLSLDKLSGSVGIGTAPPACSGRTDGGGESESPPNTEKCPPRSESLDVRGTSSASLSASRRLFCELDASDELSAPRRFPSSSEVGFCLMGRGGVDGSSTTTTATFVCGGGTSCCFPLSTASEEVCFFAAGMSSESSGRTDMGDDEYTSAIFGGANGTYFFSTQKVSDTRCRSCVYRVEKAEKSKHPKR